jgi:hypothetical protein
MKAVLVSSALLLSACATYKTNHALSGPVPATSVSERVLTATVGDTVIGDGLYSTTKAIHVENDIKVGLLGENRILAGFYVIEGEDAKSEYFKPDSGSNGGKIKKWIIADPVRGVQAYKTRQTLCTISVFNEQDCRNNAAFTRVERLVTESGSKQDQLVYDGRQGNVLTFSFVRASDPGAASDAGQVQHDLSQSTRVTYRGLAFEVVAATGNVLTYRILPTAPLES